MKTPFRAVLALAAILALSGCQKTADAAFGQKVRAYLLEHPEVIEEAVQKLQEKKIAEAANIAKAGMVKHREALERDPRDFVANPNGKITVVEFFDYRCGYCKTSAPEILKIIRDNPDVRFVFKEFPIFGGESTLAAQVALSPAGKAKGLDLYRSFMGEKALDSASIDRHLAAVGINPAQARAAGESAAVQKHISETRELAQSLGIEGTPAFIVGDRMVPGADMPALRAAIAAAKAGDTKAS
ncbi:DsbA family protein [Phenylobacterium sp.]|uniref:DsbA family protein n=1 Tax=Phenylobacterium sp. TaxID=1871053 RepID=UPI002727F83C|nr:DsbA family protein [Phenylobacterium sp.]MDO8800372.1 DsbA family protein [Phenylobacterium sp.]